MARETGRGRNAHALDSQARYLVELPASAVKATVRCPRIRAGRCPAYLASVPASSTRLGGKPAVATDVNATLSKVLAPWIRACLVLERPHRSSVPGLKTRRFTNDLKYLRATVQQRMAQAPVALLWERFQGGLVQPLVLLPATHTELLHRTRIQDLQFLPDDG